jgi:hypothetical protein
MLYASKYSIYREDCSYFEGLYFIKLQLTFRGDFGVSKYTIEFYYFCCVMKLVLQILAVIWQGLKFTIVPHFASVLEQPFKQKYVLDLYLFTN